ncbi:5,6-dimethylbenzimidazole synthase [Yoonia sp.]|uniref:5,6-dimethylbenzimidazole synthase n=1 Tax=Yoonia sp. TaxID=2212373 RepID=UPI00391DDA52
MQMSPHHRDTLHDLLQWRRDVRHFLPDPVDPTAMVRLRRAMDLAPSVGNSRPWRVIEVASPAVRSAIIANFETANTVAAAIYDADRQQDYLALKLAGLRDAPVHLAVFTAADPDEGHGLGRQSMPEMLTYSTVCAIHTLWLAARAENLGLGWVSILDPLAVARALDVPDHWHLTGYLCLGKAAQDDDTPLLHRTDWQQNTGSHWVKR